MNTSNWHIHTSWAIGALFVGLVCFFGFRQWLSDHDAMLAAVQQEKISEVIIQKNNETITTLQKQVKDVEADRDAKVAAIRKQAAAIKTPQQAVAAMPDLTGLPLSSFRPLPSGDYEVAGPALVTIAQKLEDGRVCAVQIDACNSVLASERQTNVLLTSNNAELTKEKETWKKAAGHKSFFGKLWNGTKMTAPVAAAIVVLIFGKH